MADIDAARAGDLTVLGQRDPAPPPEEGAVMGLVDHLAELRSRLVKSILAIVVGTAVGFYFAPQLFQVLKAPVPGRLVYTDPMGGFGIYIKIAFAAGVCLAMPIILYQVWAFVSPGLTREERRVARPWVPLALVFFIIGVAVAYFVLPFAMGFLLSFTIPGVLEPLITVEGYVGFVTTLFLAFGLVMEFPIVLVLLSKVGIVTSKRLSSSRRMVFLGIFIFAVVVTPGGDPFSPTALGLTMYVLYEFSIVLVRRLGH